ncbi:hypothetical protein B0I35DRAFT_477053 [Stachybotrys elegans]|uniref:Uncharacterized protein n=1 Tax=Stachybotrys elegans TaxID=80388 RepID=A0A8K0SSI1_9HYPO|nr:hypothetical protein B0I35DRAFT_477053 [Stachybotrys elegans]
MHASTVARGLTCLLPALSQNPHDPYSLMTRQELPVPDKNLDVVFPQEEGNYLLDEDGLSTLPSAASTVVRWEEGLIPQACAEISQDPTSVGDNCSLEKVEVYNVTYADCSEEPWVFCRCPDAADNLQDVVTHFGQIPVLARDFVRHVVLGADFTTPEGIVPGAIAIIEDGDIVMYGENSNIVLFLHETGHLIDQRYQPEGSDRSYAENEEFRNIADNDTCVVDEYAKNSYSELYAQVLPVLAYEWNIGAINELEGVADDTCMSGVKEAITGQVAPYLVHQAENAALAPPVLLWSD